MNLFNLIIVASVVGHLSLSLCVNRATPNRKSCEGSLPGGFRRPQHVLAVRAGRAQEHALRRRSGAAERHSGMDYGLSCPSALSFSGAGRARSVHAAGPWDLRHDPGAGAPAPVPGAGGGEVAQAHAQGLSAPVLPLTRGSPTDLPCKRVSWDRCRASQSHVTARRGAQRRRRGGRSCPQS